MPANSRWDLIRRLRVKPRGHWDRLSTLLIVIYFFLLLLYLFGGSDESWTGNRQYELISATGTLGCIPLTTFQTSCLHFHNLPRLALVEIKLEHYDLSTWPRFIFWSITLKPTVSSSLAQLFPPQNFTCYTTIIKNFWKRHDTSYRQHYLWPTVLF